MFDYKVCDALEIRPCRVRHRYLDGTELVERCDPSEADFWTVYGRFIPTPTTDGVVVLGDFDTEIQAKWYTEDVMAIHPHLKLM